MEMKIYRTVMLPVLCRCEAWSLTLREEHGLRMFGNEVLRKILGPERKKSTGDRENCMKRSFMICTPHQILLR
jgi:hypothetical protein